MEAVRKSGTRLEAELRSAKEQLRREREASVDAADRHKRSIQAMEKAVQELSDARANDQAEFQRQLGLNLDQIQTSQRDMISQRVEMDGHSKQATRLMAVQRLSATLGRALLRKKASRLVQWRVAHTNMMAQERLARTLASELQSARAAAAGEKERIVTDLTHRLTGEKDRAVAEVKEELAHRVYELRNMAAEDMRSTKARMMADRDAVVAGLEIELSREMERANKSADRVGTLSDEIRGVRAANDIAIKASRLARYI